MHPLNHPAEQGTTTCPLRYLIGARLTVPGALVAVAQEDEGLGGRARPLGDQMLAIVLVSNLLLSAMAWILSHQEEAGLPPHSVGLRQALVDLLQDTEGCVLDKENF